MLLCLKKDLIFLKFEATPKMDTAHTTANATDAPTQNGRDLPDVWLGIFVGNELGLTVSNGLALGLGLGE